MSVAMIRFYSLGFFQELARRLNEDQDWARRMKGHDVRIVCGALDRGISFLLDIRDGVMTASEAGRDTSADFTFEGMYADWMRLCKGEAEFEELIETGRIRFAGSMPNLMSLMGLLNRIVLTARSFPKEF
jgi:alkyl sulfatase BDS1-like metallo-beta-lactamase superfamily hydrolase